MKTESDSWTSCPKCGADWDGGSILETFIKQRDAGAEYRKGQTDEQSEEGMKQVYAPPYRWGRQIGIETPGYDGISYWQCPDCGKTFNRFTGKEEEIPQYC